MSLNKDVRDLILNFYNQEKDDKRNNRKRLN